MFPQVLKQNERNEPLAAVGNLGEGSTIFSPEEVVEVLNVEFLEEQDDLGSFSTLVQLEDSKVENAFHGLGKNGCSMTLIKGGCYDKSHLETPKGLEKHEVGTNKYRVPPDSAPILSFIEPRAPTSDGRNSISYFKGPSLPIILSF